MASNAIGIDLGTTYSCVGVFRSGRVKIIKNNHGNCMTPSCVAFTDDQIVVGDSARSQLASNAANTVFAVKRLIGRRFSDECVQNDVKYWPFKVVCSTDDQPVVEVQHRGETKRFKPEYLSSLILADLKATAENYLGQPVTDAVITIPANYGNAQRQATLEAARLAGLNVLRLVNEPTAAALAYGFENTEDKSRRVLIFDLGGGTLDVSVLSIDESNHFEVEATAGNSHLGGDDFDNRLLVFFADEFMRKFGENLMVNQRAVRRLIAVCERAKRVLSQYDPGSVEVDNLHKGWDLQSKVTREQFESMCADLFEQTIPPIEQALADAKMSKEDIHEILLVGGSSRIPKIQQLLQSYFAGQRLNKTIDPDEAIAYGAAILAAELSGAAVFPTVQRMMLSDVTGLSFGVKDNDGKFEVFIPRGSRIPISVKQQWVTVTDYDTDCGISVYEGDAALAADNNFLRQFKISYPSLPAGQVCFDFVMEIDVNGVLHMSTTETSTGKTEKITITRRRVTARRHSKATQYAATK